MNIDDFKMMVRNERNRKVLSSFELVYDSFVELRFDQENEDFFFMNASSVVEELRILCWAKYLAIERNFSAYIYEKLIDTKKLENLNKIEAIKWYTSHYTEHIYALSLSNTQSRRSRAGNEFEAIIELLLMGANIPFDTQGSIGSGVFESNHLAKLVDCVSPGASEYKIDKRNTSLISAKTTLRERWQEVGDEMSRTMAREMYLATLDDSISDNTLKLIGGNNIILVTTKGNKNRFYPTSPYVMSFETMLEELATKSLVWENYNYSTEEIKAKKERFNLQIELFGDKEFIIKYYENQISGLN